MDLSIQYVMMRTSLGEVLLSDFLCVLQVTQQHRNRVEISNATAGNVGMAQEVNHFFYRKVTLGHIQYYYEAFIVLKSHCQEAIM